MNTSDILAIASFAITVAGIIFVIGKNSQRLNVVERDLNRLGIKIEDKIEDLDRKQNTYEEKLDSQVQFMTLTAERLVNLKERLFDGDISEGKRG